ncbi:MAG: homocysteine S-methyltransferase family protein [Gammaproteobacteria bacterium]|nr:homocysteine S-methyltransferase family protein [Gammaproteobacteria bacterium]
MHRARPGAACLRHQLRRRRLGSGGDHPHHAHRPAGHEANLVAKANCGIPEYHDGKIVYNGTPDLMARYAVLARDAGARIIGGCCGTTPDHVAAMRKALESVAADGPPAIETVVAELGPISAGAMRCCTGGGAPAAEPRRAGRRRRRGAS